MKMNGYSSREIGDYLKNNPTKTAWEVSASGEDWARSFFFLQEKEARKFAREAWSEYGEEVKTIYLSEYWWNSEVLIFENSDVEEFATK